MDRYDKDLQEVLRHLDFLADYYATNQYALESVLRLRREVKKEQEYRITDKINEEIQKIGEKYGVELYDAEDYGPGMVIAHLLDE